VTYDDWKSTEPDPFADDDYPEDDACDVCGAHSSEPCAWDCSCEVCEQRFGRVPEKTA
jgi:hypothetical protein